jgi:hypothetical protein
MKLFFILVLGLMSFTAFSQDKNIRYEYKKFEKFDLDELGVEGEAGSPGDISVNPRARDKFKNKLPERQNFNKEMRKAVQGIR